MELSCDDRDNNCDGDVDEGFPRLFGTNWQGDATPRPGVRSESAIAFIPGTFSLVLFGGRAGGPAGDERPLLDDLWSFSLLDTLWGPWAADGATAGPSPRAAARLVPDDGHERLLLVGGCADPGTGTTTALAEVWALTGDPALGEEAHWEELVTLDTPVGWRGHDAVVDEARDTLWVFGLPSRGLAAPLQALRLSELRWEEAAAGPDGRRGASLSLDVEGDALILYGGWDAQGNPGALGAMRYHLDGPGSWEALDASASPPPRCCHAALFDRTRRRLIIHGGEALGGNLLSDTWVLDLQQGVWTRVQATPAPEARLGATLLRLPGLDAAFLLGGHDASGNRVDDIWSFDLDSLTWARTVLSDDASPPPLRHVASAFDPADGRWYLVGGLVPTVDGERASDEVWIRRLDDALWQVVSPAGDTPPALSRSAAAFDTNEGRLLVFGGRSADDDGYGSLESRLWALDADTHRWTLLHNGEGGPPPRTDPSAVFCEDEGVLRVFGGRTTEGVSNELWVYDMAANAWWREEPEAAAPPAFEGHTALWSPEQGAMFVVGESGEAAHILRYDRASLTWTSIASWTGDGLGAPAVWQEPYTTRFLVGARPDDAPATFFQLVESGQVSDVSFPTESPEAVDGAAALYDPRTRRVYLYGGAAYRRQRSIRSGVGYRLPVGDIGSAGHWHRISGSPAPATKDWREERAKRRAG